MNAAVDSFRRVEQLRVPPQSGEAEQAVLGGLMLSPAALAKVSDWLAPEDFYRRDHQLIYRAILEAAGKGRVFDAVTLGDWFEAAGQAEQVAGGAYLVELATTTPSAANIVAYAEIVKDKATLRQGIEVGTALVNDCFQPEGRDTGEIISERLRALSNLRGESRIAGLVSASSTLGDWYDDLEARYNNGGGMTGIPYPWAEVNKVTHGLQPGELTIIAARPSMGKSVMGLNLALMNAMRKVNTALFSLEMTGRQVNRRNIASLGKVPHDWLLAPSKEGDDYWPFVTAAIREIRESTLLVDESAGLRIEQIAARARRAHMQKPIGLIVLDHMHDVALPGKREARFEIGAIAEAGKSLAKEFGCPAVWLAQLNRGVESRPNKRPNMGDLRESGEIEQKADVIWFLYREDYYRRNEAGYQPTRAVELILAKGRDLEVGKPILLREDFAHMRLMDWEGPEPDFGEPTTTKKGLR